MEQWRIYLGQDLRADSVQSPARDGKYWLLYFPPKDRISDDAPTIRCRLCRACAAALRRLVGKGKDSAPKPQLSTCARAYGLWGGPEPEELRRLSYLSRRILTLASVYFTLKRVMIKDAVWAKRDTSALPQYSTNNVVAYPQDPDAAIVVLCLLPAHLYRVITVQFTGSDPRVVRGEPSLITDLVDLRAALAWLVSRNCHWMVATKGHGPMVTEN